MSMQYKILEFKSADRRKDGGRITISTGGVDRDKDRVFPQGAKTANYLNNPVVLWGHNYYSAESLIGRSRSIEVTETGIVADFELRPAANESDPQNVVLLLWEQEFVRAASIGFLPNWEKVLPNDFGGLDFVDWELLEFSLVSVPANADALRLAAKQFPDATAAFLKSGRVLSAANEKRIADARDNLDAVLEQLAEDDDGKTLAAIGELKTLVTALDTKIDTITAQTRAATPPADDDSDARDLLARLDQIAQAVRRSPARITS